MTTAPVLETAITSPLRPLSLEGVCRYHIDGETIVMEADEIASHRACGNLSGTLSLEMWALPAPYQGGPFTGHQVAAATLGQLHGQHCFRHWRHTQKVQTPAEGLWYLVMLLREWDNGAWVTRDYINFPEPLRASYRLVLSLDGLPMIVPSAKSGR